MLPSVLHLVLPGAALVCSMMFILWIIHLRIRNASIVDPGWAFGLPLVAVTYALLGHGYAQRKWLAAGMAVLWGVRLGVHLLVRIVGQPEEGRYQELRRQWKTQLPLKFLIFFEFQALLDLFLSLPFLLAALNPAPTLSAFEYAGIALWLIALAGEAVADAQLAAFKRDPSSHGQVCQRGLWNYSRHPNYFFEWLGWLAYPVIAIRIADPWTWAALVGPVVMFAVLMVGTGVPPLEQAMLRSKGEAYRRYQAKVSLFFPRPPKEIAP